MNRDAVLPVLATMLSEAAPCCLGNADSCGQTYVTERAGLEPCCVARRTLTELAKPLDPPAPPKGLTHPFRAHTRYPWFCRDCGYGAGEALKHGPSA